MPQLAVDWDCERVNRTERGELPGTGGPETRAWSARSGRKDRPRGEVSGYGGGSGAPGSALAEFITCTPA
jgi:hypothetical protein